MVWMMRSEPGTGTPGRGCLARTRALFAGILTDDLENLGLR